MPVDALARAKHGARIPIIVQEKPWPLPPREDCLFYHDNELPNGEPTGQGLTFDGFSQYIGNYPIAGKTVLDVGTAGGYLAFSAERAGASRVAAIDMGDSLELNEIPYEQNPLHKDRILFMESWDDLNRKLRNGFWYCWHKLNSKVEVYYTPFSSFPFWDQKFDVVFAGALIEHLSDPVTAIGRIASLAKEALIISFTMVADTDEQIMRTTGDWDDPVNCYTWWTLSRGLYNRVFANIGFDVEYVTSYIHDAAGNRMERPTIIARRKQPLA